MLLEKAIQCGTTSELGIESASICPYKDAEKFKTSL